MKILVCDPDQDWQKRIVESLSRKEHNLEVVNNGRNGQHLLNQHKFDFVFIDLDLQDFSSIEVVRYIRFKNLKSKIVLMTKDESMIDQYFKSKSNLKRVGVSDVLIKPFSDKVLEQTIDGLVCFQDWRNIKKREMVEGEEEEITAADDLFTSIKIEEFFCGNLAIFDIFIRLKKNKYLKILNVGESLEQERLSRYAKEKNITHLYFKTKERAQYINFMNELISHLIKNGKASGKAQLEMIKNVSEKVLEEIYTRGIDENILGEAITTCDNIHHVINKNKDLHALFSEYIEYNDTIEAHLYLTALYSEIITNNLPWVTNHSRPKILMGAFLHDIGKLKLPRNIRDKHSESLTPDQFEIYKEHCRLGVELLDRVPNINEQIKQIVYQHHEYINGQGFPNRLPGNKIYPLAKIVAFANKLADITTQRRVTPLEALKFLMKEKTDIYNYDSEVIKAFVKSFINDK